MIVAPPTVLTVPEAAIKIGCCVQHLRDMIKEGQIPAHNVGHGSLKHYRIQEKDLEAYLTSIQVIKLGQAPLPEPEEQLPKRFRRVSAYQPKLTRLIGR